MSSALCIGINNYPGTQNDLAGCVNDAKDWAKVLKDRGFSVTMILDEKATRSTMISAMNKVVTETRPGEAGVITYSGHGSWQADQDGDEPDGRDEALCPHDLATGLLIDDDLYRIFAKQQPGARIIFLSDSCHSGSVATLAPPLGEQDRGRVRFLPPETFQNVDELTRSRKVEKAPTRGLSRGTALLISGCKDTEYSYDANFGGRPNGAFTRVAIDALGKLGGSATYAEWFQSIRAALPSRDYPQTPQLTASSDQRQWPVLA